MLGYSRHAVLLLLLFSTNVVGKRYALGPKMESIERRHRLEQLQTLQREMCKSLDRSISIEALLFVPKQYDPGFLYKQSHDLKTFSIYMCYLRMVASDTES